MIDVGSPGFGIDITAARFRSTGNAVRGVQRDGLLEQDG